MAQKMSDSLGINHEDSVTKSIYAQNVETEVHRHIAFLLYEIDRYESFMTRLPLLQVDLPGMGIPLGILFGIDVKLYDFKTYEALYHMELARMNLFQIFGKVIQLDQSRKNMTHCKSKILALDLEIKAWFTSLPHCLNQMSYIYSPESITFNPQAPPWKLAYLHCMAHFLLIILYRNEFIDSMVIDPVSCVNDHCFNISVNAAYTISYFTQCFLKLNPMFCHVPYFISTITYNAAFTLILLTKFQNPSQISDITVTFISTFKSALRNMSLSWFPAKVQLDKLLEMLQDS